MNIFTQEEIDFIGKRLSLTKEDDLLICIKASERNHVVSKTLQVLFNTTTCTYAKFDLNLPKAVLLGVFIKEVAYKEDKSIEFVLSIDSVAGTYIGNGIFVESATHYKEMVVESNTSIFFKTLLSLGRYQPRKEMIPIFSRSKFYRGEHEISD